MLKQNVIEQRKSLLSIDSKCEQRDESIKSEFVINTYAALIFREKALFPTNFYYKSPDKKKIAKQPGSASV